MPRRKLFVANLTQAIVMVDPRGTDQPTLTDAQRKKCNAQAARLLWLCDKEDAVLLPHMPEEAFLAYAMATLGFLPQVYVPKPEYVAKEPSVIAAALRDRELLNELSFLGANGVPPDIVPFVQDIALHRLAREIGLPVVGMSEQSAHAGRATELNDKALFQNRCCRLGIAVPASILHCRAERDLFPGIAYQLYNRFGSIVVRQTRAAGGSGNVKIVSGYREWAMFKAALAPAMHLLEGGDVLVEPYYPFSTMPTVLMRITKKVPEVIAIVMREVKNLTSTGGLMPANLPDDVVEALVQQSLAYASDIARFVIDGDVDIDWGILDGDFGKMPKMLALESNCRMTGTGPVVAVRCRLYGSDASSVFSWNCDSVAVGGRSFAEVRDLLNSYRLLWCDGEGAVIMTPPHAGSMGVAVFGLSQKRRDDFRNTIQALFGRE